jgi:hypothetical protein
MNKKRLNLFLTIGFVLIISVSLVSASWFGDFFGKAKITGKVTSGYLCSNGQNIGDVDGNGEIQAADASIVQQIAAGLVDYPSDICCADADQNGVIQAADASLIQQIAAGIASSPGTCLATNLTKTCESGYTCLDSDNFSIIYNHNNLDYIINLISATDTSATLQILAPDGTSQTSTLNEGESKSFMMLNIYLKEADETNHFLSVVIQISLATLTECTDSDGGKNYYVKGTVTPYNKTDSCITDFSNTNIEMGDLEEYYCTDDENEPWALKRYYCSNGCSDGACIKNQYSGTCSGLVDFVANPVDLTDYYGLEFILSSNDLWEEEESTTYWARWSANDVDGFYSIEYYITVYNNESFDASTLLSNLGDYKICTEKWVNGNTIYVCNQDPFRKDGASYLNVMWTKENVFVSVDVGYFKTYEQQNSETTVIQHKDVQDFIDNLKNNNFKSVNTIFVLNSHTLSLIEKNINLCPSNLKYGELPSFYDCKVEPVICPEYGYQTQICTAWDPSLEKETIKKQQIDCSPGICSGCYVPKWFDYNGNNKCIPYGFRFESQIGWREGEKQTNGETQKVSIKDMTNAVGINLSITSNGLVTLYVSEWGNKTYTFKEGDKVDVDVTGWDNEFTSLSFVATKVVYDSTKYENSYVIFDFTYEFLGKVADNINAYCDIDGYVKQQKTKEAGEWAKCQNNYECDSNLCSSGECVELKDIANEASAFKKLAVKVFCRILSIFGEEYNQCLIDNGI